MASLEFLRPMFTYLSQLHEYATSRMKQDDPDDKQIRTYSFGSYRHLRRKKSLITRYGFFSTLTCEAYVARGFGLMMDVITGRRLVLLLSILLTAWLMVFIHLSFVEVWQYPVEDFRRDIRKNMDEMDSSLRKYRLIRPLNEERHFHVRTPLDAPPAHNNPHFKKKVLIFAYKRGGGSVFAEIFNHDPNGMLWYESLDPFYVAKFGVRPNVNPRRVTENSDNSERDLVKSERKWLSDTFRQIYYCQTQSMPVELILHNYMLDLHASAGFRECVDSLNIPHLDQATDNCSARIQEVCGPTVDHSIRMQCPTILNAGMRLRETIHQMEGDLTEYLRDENITRALERQFDGLLGPVRHSLPPKFAELFPLFLEHQFCLASLEQSLKPCQPQVVDTCSGKTLGVAHVVRLKSEDLRFILRDFPTMHLVFYVRDPRAIAHSRMMIPDGGGRLSPRDQANAGRRIVEEARELCPKMLADYWEMVKLQNKFPKVSFIIAKYEDMVMHPYEMAMEFYNHLGMWLPETYKLYVETHMIVDKAEYLFGSSNPAQGNETLQHWQDVLNKNEIRDINKHCRDVLDLFQYSH